MSPNPLLPELEAEIDMRLANLLEDVPVENADRTFKLMRACYAIGYETALKEADRGELYKRFGYQLPQRQSA